MRVTHYTQLEKRKSHRCGGWGKYNISAQDTPCYRAKVTVKQRVLGGHAVLHFACHFSGLAKLESLVLIYRHKKAKERNPQVARKRLLSAE